MGFDKLCDVDTVMYHIVHSNFLNILDSGKYALLLRIITLRDVTEYSFNVVYGSFP